jgi:hypothetical protein
VYVKDDGFQKREVLRAPLKESMRAVWVVSLISRNEKFRAEPHPSAA